MKDPPRFGNVKRPHCFRLLGVLRNETAERINPTSWPQINNQQEFLLGRDLELPAERLIVMILDRHGKIIRRLEQIRGNCVDES